MGKRNRNQRGSALAGMFSLTGSDRGRVRTVEVEDAPRETAKSFREAYDREQAQKEAAKQKAARIAAGRTLLQQPSEYLTENCGKLDTNKDPQTIIAGVRSAFTAFRDELLQKDVTLLDGALKKFDHIAGELNPTLDWADVETFRIAYALMQDGGLLTSEDVIDLRVNEEPEQEAQPAQQDFDSLDSQSAKDVVLSAVQSDVLEWFRGWEATLSRDFGGFSLTEAQTAAVVRFLDRGMVNHRTSSGWHSVRKSLVAAGTLPTLLYPSEIFDQQIESSPLDSFEQKQAYAREFHRLKELPNGGAPPQFYPSYS